MPRFLLALTVTLTALTFTLALTARAWGETQPPHPALRGFVEGCEGKGHPCLFGIVGHWMYAIPLEMAHDYLTQQGYTVIQDGQLYGADFYTRTYRALACETGLIYNTADSNKVEGLLINCDGVRVGDLFILWGEPDYVFLDYPGFMYGKEWAGLESDSHNNLLAPVLRIVMTSLLVPDNAYSWHGVAPAWKYCQIESGSVCP